MLYIYIYLLNPIDRPTKFQPHLHPPGPTQIPCSFHLPVGSWCPMHGQYQVLFRRGTRPAAQQTSVHIGAVPTKYNTGSVHIIHSGCGVLRNQQQIKSLNRSTNTNKILACSTQV